MEKISIKNGVALCGWSLIVNNEEIWVPCVMLANLLIIIIKAIMTYKVGK